MKLKWQWFLGGPIMFWVGIILFILLFISFTLTYFVDITSFSTKSRKKIDTKIISDISEEYVKNLGMIINKPLNINLFTLIIMIKLKMKFY